METWRVPIEGMTCTSCVARITRAVRKVPGVERVRVDLVSDSATVAFDPARTALEAVAVAVKEAGYEARAEVAERVVPDDPGGLLRRFGLRSRRA